jgi:hypothetical protein
VIADTPAIDGARIFGAIVPVVAVLGGFTRKSAFTGDADTGGVERDERALGTILDWHALAHALGAGVLGTLVPVVALVGALAFSRTTSSTITTRATTSTIARSLTAPNQRNRA